MKLSRITKLRFRVFRNFVWPKELHSFARFNVIYGWNGSGKTTLSSLLSSVEKKETFSEGDVELEFDGATKVAGSTFASVQLPQVRVFNRDFINATLSQTSGIEPIYFLGKDSIEKQKQLEVLKKELAARETALMNAQEEKKKTESNLDNFCKDKAKLIKELLTTSNSQAYNNYDKRKFRLAAEAMDTQRAATATLPDERKEQLRLQKDAQPKPSVNGVAAPSIKLDVLSGEVSTLVARSVVAQTLDELTRDTQLARWVQEGLALHSGEHATETCRFCHQPLQATRRAALEAHFNDSFARFQKDLSTLLAKLKAVRQSVASLSLPDTSRFYEALESEVLSAREMVLKAQSETQVALDALVERVETKLAHPFTPTVTQIQAATIPPSIADAVAIFNEVVEKHNHTSAEFTTSINSACKELETSYIAESYPEFARLDEAIKAANTELDNIKAKQKEIQKQINELEREILEHRRPADELTEELRAYLGRDELRFEVKDTGYALTRNGHNVEHLSEGERTAITFLYFLKSLQDREFDLENGIVVIDDPVSSLDDNAQFSAFGYMKERTKDAGQLFILTHSFSFFRLVKNWFHNLPGQRKENIEKRPARFFRIRARRNEDGRRASDLGHLDPLLENYESEYQYLFKRVYDEAHRDDVDKLEHHYGSPNIARRLLEAFLAFRFPHRDNLHSRLEQVKFDNAKKTRILRLLHTYSHADAIADPGHDLSLLSETPSVLRDMLEMMKTVDGAHYEGLVKSLKEHQSAGEQVEP